MNKNELIDAIASGSGLSKADAGRALEAFLGSVTSTLAGGGSVKITGFGTFSVSHRAATTGRNPRTGEAIQIAASKNAKFKPPSWTSPPAASVHSLLQTLVSPGHSPDSSWKPVLPILPQRESRHCKHLP